jgi:regulator of protease activity HflC (stomatin/prohibitin superfamily)
VITKDNVTMQIDTVVYFQVMDAKLYTYGVTKPHRRHRESFRHHAAQHHRRP